MNKLISFLSGLLIGTGVAILVTLLVTPRSGPETRELIADKSIELKERVQDITSHSRKSNDELADEIERELGEDGYR